MPYEVYDDPYSFNIEDNSNKFPIYMIHGSVTNTKEAIDTVTQKIRGLSYEQEVVLKNLFENNPFIFIGFSGADFDFKDYYIPINYSKKGITWVTWDISNRIKLFEKNIPNFRIKSIKGATLYSFYEEIGWKEYCG
ncbi:MAG: SIR2 family protein, partial [Clostridia bacterium]|nr:SIR2 family protein [Clostridia bacterium]